MKLYGSLERLVSILFRKNSQDITVRPNQATTYTAARDIQLPPGDADSVLVGSAATQTLTNKTIDGDDNTIQDLALASLKTVLGDAAKVVRYDDSGVPAAGPLTVSDAGAVDGATSLDVDNLNLDGNTISSTDTDGNIVLSPDGTGVVQSSADLELRSGSALILSDDDNSQAITINAPSALTAAYSLVLPDNDGSANQFLQTDGSGNLTWASGGISSFEADWVTGDGTSKTIVHNLNTKDVQIEIYDKTDDSTIWVDSVIRTDADTLDLTASEAPPAAGWRVTIHAT